VLHDGPVHEAPRLVRDALALIGAPAAQPPVPIHTTATETVTGGRVMPGFTSRADAPIIKVSDIAYVRFARRDLALAERYFRDFGLHVSARTDKAIYLRGLLARHHCVIVEQAAHDGFAGLGLCAATAADLRTLAAALGASVQASDEPGGGEVVRLRDPAGLPVEVVYGSEPLPELSHRQPRVANLPGRKLRVNAPQPAIAGPAEVFRLGHAVLQRQEFVKNANWYVKTFGLIASDVEVLPGSREPLIAFMRCDRGSEPSDHHTVVIAFGPEDGFDHAAFETLDLDSVGLGAEWLQQKGWVKSWGVGRHILGSQIFCYHYDPSGFAVEHYADGDVFDASCPTRFHEADVGAIYAWGPDLPKHFIDTGMSLRRVGKVLRGLRSRSEFTLARLLAAKRTYSSKPRPWAGRAFHKPKPT
jgi:catechol 2,3-dioxygenase-like lactoylglutathione lyase family enzyme